jgi:hypothetical protein
MAALASLLVGSSARAGQRIAIVSDLDDTIKTTEVANPLKAIFHSVARTDGFAGMPELYNAEAAPLFVITGSPRILKFRVKAFLKKNDYHASRIYVRNWFTRHPERVAAIYIHRITGKELPDGEKSFVTAIDLAQEEFEAGRLDESSAIRVGDAILRAHKAERVLAHYARCPQDLSTPIEEKTDLDLVREAVQRELQRICARPHRDDDDRAPEGNLAQGELLKR